MTERCGKCYGEMQVEYLKTTIGLVVKRMTCKLHGETNEYIGTAKVGVSNSKTALFCRRCRMNTTGKLYADNHWGLICEECHAAKKEHSKCLN